MSVFHSSQDLLNARTYYRPGVERSYLHGDLTRMETMALLTYQPAFADKEVLDIGVGAGRTSNFLAPMARHYLGVDYSPVMVRYLQNARPDIAVLQADMRELAGIADSSFDFVFAPNNVLDAVGHDDRLLTFSQFHRVLRDNGMLAFSSHNRDCVHAHDRPHLNTSPTHPIRQIRELGTWARQLANHWRYHSMCVESADYALHNDEGHDYALLHYYINPKQQRIQLEGEGFRLCDTFDIDGLRLGGDNSALESASLMYVAAAVAD